jgi:hypothetical protein
MPSWLVDDPTMVYLVLGLLALALGAIWWINRGEDYGKKKLGWLQGLKARRLTPNQCCAMGLTVIGFLGVIIWPLSLLVVTDHERICQAIGEMSGGVEKKDVPKIFSHVSEQFNLAGRTKESYRQEVERLIRIGEITEVAAWDFEQAKVSRQMKEATIEFKVKPKGTTTGREPFYRCRATFSLDPDGQWRLRTFVVFEPHGDPASQQVIFPR